MKILLRFSITACTFLAMQGCATIPGGGTIHMPDGEGRFRAILVLHTGAGLKNHEKVFASKLSQHDYVAVAVNWWEGRDTDLTKTWEYLLAQSYVDPHRIGLVGFSRGGRAALWFASRLSVMQSDFPIAGVVNYYQGNSIVQWVKGTKHPPTLFLHGELDERVEPIEIVNYCAQQRTAGTICDYHFYEGVRHSFDVHPNRLKFNYGAYNASATDDAWLRTLEFPDRHVKNKPGWPCA